MTDVERKRAYVLDLYSGPKWKKKVAKMPDDQVVAIYLNHQRDGEKPEHDESEAELIPEVKPQPHIDIPSNGRGPHANEDLFEIY